MGHSLGMRIVEADSGSDSNSESWNKNEEIIPVNHLTQTVWIAPPTKDILCADWRHPSESESEPESSCTTLCADSQNQSWNLNLPAPYAYPWAGVPSSATSVFNDVNILKSLL